MPHFTFANRLKFALKIIAIAGFALPALPIQWLFVRFNSNAQRYLPVIFHRYVAFIIGLKIHVKGAPSKNRPLMLVSNHVSWLDIVALSAVCPVSFIAKSEIEGWGVFGLFARLQRSIFVNRSRRAATKKVNETIAERLKRNDVMLLFGEGTTGNGCAILPFKSSLIGVAGELKSLWFQPVSIVYTKLSGLPAGRYDRAHTAWYGNMELLPNLRSILTGPPIDAVIRFGSPHQIDIKTNRKKMAADLEAMSRQMTYEAHYGRKTEF